MNLASQSDCEKVCKFDFQNITHLVYKANEKLCIYGVSLVFADHTPYSRHTMSMFAPMIKVLKKEYEKVAAAHLMLREQEVTMQRSREVLEVEIRKLLELKLVLDIQIQALREAEWQAEHPVRVAATQVQEFQLEPPRMMQPVVQSSPTSPDPEPAVIPRPMGAPA